MKKGVRTSIGPFFVVAVVLALPSVLLGQVKVILSGGFFAAYQELLPDFERKNGITITTGRGPSQGNGSNTIAAQLRRGVPADVVIMSREGLNELIAEGRIAADTVVDLAQVPLGVAVRAGAVKPDISSVAAFKQTLLRARSIGIQSTSAIYMTTRLFPQLGIAGAMSAKITNGGAEDVAQGSTEMAVLPVSELVRKPGTDYIGTIPKEIQFVAVFSAAMLVGSKESDASRRLIAFLASEDAKKAIRKSGMEPLGAR